MNKKVLLTGISGNGIGCDSTLSSTDIQLFNEIQLHPNPTDRNYTLDFGADLANEISTISVYNLMGKKIDSYSSHQVRFMNFEINEAPGIYFVVVQSEFGINTIRLIKK